MKRNGAYAFLVDEAHNLVDRSRDMFSADVRKSAFSELRRAVKSDLPAVYRAAGKDPCLDAHCPQTDSGNRRFSIPISGSRMGWSLYCVLL